MPGAAHDGGVASDGATVERNGCRPGGRDAEEVAAMFPHPDTACALKEMDRRALLAEAAEARRAAQVRRAAAERPVLAATVRRYLGSAMVAIGRRLQGAEPAGPARTAPAGSSAAA